MAINSYPTLLNKRATMLGSLTRYDLSVIGVSYLVLSAMKVSGMYSLMINAFLLLILKVIKQRFQVGFFKHLGAKRLIYSGDLQRHFEGGRDE
tara:strand:+ start:274 stop:552 length:279 start_codon:yes stop_codon:yes gene_type:complete